jgi:pimeloyl-ACP methyl ester carboxylesterase
MRFVLVHGGSHGGWCWDAVSAYLRSAGHEVFTPTLRGSEEGAVDRDGVNLTTMGEGLVHAIKEHDLDDFVLVGHSGGGPVAQYAADRLAKQTRRIVFVDGWVLHDGEAIKDAMPAQMAELWLGAAEVNADQSIPLPVELWADFLMNGASEQDIAAFAEKLVPTPLGWINEPISLPRFWKASLPSSYIVLRQDRMADFARTMAARLEQPRLLECDGPHDAMLTHPKLLAGVLVDAANEAI